MNFHDGRNESIHKSDHECWFRFILHAYRDKVLHFISLYVPDTRDREELAADVFVTLWNKRKERKKIKNIENYLFIIAKNSSLNHLRKTKTKYVEAESETMDRFYNTKFNPESIFITRETIGILDDAINQLPTKTKAAFQLVRLNKMKYKDAAEVLGVSVKTIEKQVASAITKLKEILQNNEH